MESPVRILGFAGSLRQGSYNRALLRAALELIPEDAALEIQGLDGIPSFNADLLGSIPGVVLDFKAKIEATDALLIVTPEYNFSIPGVLKNAMDWASRPHESNAFRGKPAAIMSASTGMLGGARAQYHLRQVFVYLDVHTINKPEVFVASCAQKFDAELRFTDEKGREIVRDLLKSLVALARQLKAV